MSDSAVSISVITLGVSDVGAAIRFYRDGLGFSIGTVKGDITYFDTGGTWLAVFPRRALARYAHVSAEGGGFSGVTPSRNVDTPEAVNVLMEKAQAAGAQIVSPAAEAGGGGYTTNAIESLNYSLRKVLKNRGAFPSDESILKVLYLGMQHVAKKWSMPIRDWKATLNQFVILFGDRVPV